MQRHELLATLSELKLRGMVAAFDEAVVQGLRLRRPVEEILGDLLRAEAAERRSRSICYLLGVAGLPVMKDLESFRFDPSPVNAALMGSLHDGTFLAAQRNVVLVGGTGSGKTHLAPRHPRRGSRPVLQRRRSGQPPRAGEPPRQARRARRPASDPQTAAAIAPDLSIPEPAPHRLSRAHFRLVARGGQVPVHDLNSMLGTIVNGLPSGAIFPAFGRKRTSLRVL